MFSPQANDALAVLLQALTRQPELEEHVHERWRSRVEEPRFELVEYEETDASATAHTVAPPPTQKRGGVLKVVVGVFVMATLAGASLAAWVPFQSTVSAARSQASLPLASGSKAPSTSSPPRGPVAATNQTVAVGGSAKKEPVKAVAAKTAKSPKRAHKLAGKPAKPSPKKPKPAA